MKSFAVVGDDQAHKTEYIRKYLLDAEVIDSDALSLYAGWDLLTLMNVKDDAVKCYHQYVVDMLQSDNDKMQLVQLVISLSGIKVCDVTGQVGTAAAAAAADDDDDDDTLMTPYNFHCLFCVN